jgi:hypothetical protein
MLLKTGHGAVSAAPTARTPTARLFHLVRAEDMSGISGTGRVAEGVLFSNGWVAMRWLSDRPSMNFFASIDDVVAIHGHDNKTKIVFE